MRDNSVHERDTLEELVEEYLSLRRDNSGITIKHFAKQNPLHEEDILDLFPTLLALEKYKPSETTVRGPHVAENHEGKKLGDYQLLREIGRGGMGIVYEARHISLGRQVAIKTLAAHRAAEKNNLQRFEREAKAAANLHHNNIVPVFGVGRTESTNFLVMQLIDGQGLDNVIAELRHLTHEGNRNPTVPHRPSVSSELISGRIEDLSKFFRRVAQIGLQVASGLHYAHTQGVLHRDVKPANILLDASAKAWLTDFGLAKIEQDEGLTQTGHVLGTLRYMAPESIKCNADARSDIYSLGLTLFELIALRPAFQDGEKGSIVEQVMSPKVRLESTTAAPVPADLVAIVNKAIEPLPDFRYQTAKDMAEDLQRYIDDSPIQARKSSTILRLSKWRRKNRVLANSLAGAMLLLTLFLLCSVSAAFYFRQLSDRLEDSVVALEIANAESEAQREAAERAVYSSQLALTQSRLSAEDTAGALRALESVIPDVHASDHRGWEWYYLDYASSGYGRQLEVRGQLGASVAFSPDGKLIASAIMQSKAPGTDTEFPIVIVIHEVASGRVVREIAAESGQAKEITFSPSGELVAAIVGDRFEIYDVNEGTTVYVQTKSGDRNCKYPRRIKFSPDGSKFLLVWKDYGGKGITQIHDTGSLKRITSFKGRCAEFSSDSAQVYYSSGRQIKSKKFALVAGNSQNDQVVVPELESGTSIWAITASGDGRNLAYGRGDRAIVLNLQTKSVRQLSIGYRPQLMSFSQAGDRLSVMDQIAGRVQIWNPESGEKVASFCGLNPNSGTSFSADFRLRAASDRSGMLSIFPGEKDGRATGLHHRWIAHASSIQFSSDDQTVFSVTKGRVDSWTLPDFSNYSSRNAGYGQDAWPRADWSISPNGLFVAGPQKNNPTTAGVWHISDNSKLMETTELTSSIRQVVFSRDSSTLGVLATNREGSEIQIWNLEAQSLLFSHTIASKRVNSIALGNEGKLLSIAPEQDAIRVCYTPTSEHFTVEMSRSLGQVMFSPNNRFLAATDPLTDSVQIFDLQDRTLVAEHGSIRAAFGLDWSPDGRRLAVAGYDHVHLFDAISGSELLILQRLGRPTGTMGYTPCIKFSHDGRRLAANSAHSVLTIWDAGPRFDEAR